MIHKHDCSVFVLSKKKILAAKKERINSNNIIRFEKVLFELLVLLFMSLNTTENIPLIRKYSPLTCDILSELRNSGEYCDVILRTDDQRLFKVHRAILCCKID